ncbi:MAG: sulfite exporter TauE/SafE family protein [Patescibacteria group bacterium]
MLLFYFGIIIFSILAGVIGALVGIGGGIIIIPILILIFHINIKIAIGASIISVIATSSSAASVYLKDKIINIKVGMLLEIATTIGAITGAEIMGILNTTVLLYIFAFVLLISILPLLKNRDQEVDENVENDNIADYLKLSSSYYDKKQNKKISYNVTNIPGGFVIMYIAGLISGLLGIGSGVFKVLALDDVMKLPMKVSTTTSNMMIGVTAAASAFIYLINGYINPYIAIPVMIGVFIGSYYGTELIGKTSNVYLKKIFILVILVIAIEMILRAMHVL